MPFFLTVLLGSVWVLAVDSVGAWIAVRSKVDYGYWLPVSVLGHVAFGAATALLAPGVRVFIAALVVGLVESTLGTLITHRQGAFGDDAELVLRWTPYLIPISVPLVAAAAWWGSWLVR